MSFLRQLGRTETRSASFVTDAIADAIGSRRAGMMPGTAPKVDEKSGTTLSAMYGATRVITAGFAAIPVHEYETKTDDRGRSWPQRTASQPQILTDPWFEMVPFTWRQYEMKSLLLRGNALGVVMERDRQQYPTQIMPVHPSLVRLDLKGRRGSRRLQYSIGGERVPNEDMMHVVGMPDENFDGLVGLSMIAHFARTLGITIASEDYALRYFAEGTHPQSILETDQALSDDEAEETQAAWIASGASRVPRVLSGGLKWKPISIPPEEAQFLETRGFGVEEVVRITGVPAHKLGVTGAVSNWGTGIEQQQIGYVTDVLQPWLVLWEQHYTRMRPRGKYVKHNVNGLLRGDSKARAAWYIAMRTLGAMNNDEIRALEDQPPLPDDQGQDYMAPFNNTAKAADSPTPQDGEQ